MTVQHEELFGVIDAPAESAVVHRGAVDVAGWALDRRGPIGGVVVLADSRVRAVATMSVRSDVAAEFADVPHAPRSGWSATLDLGDAPSGEVTIAVDALGVDGRWHRIAERTVTVGATSIVLGRIDMTEPGTLPRGAAVVNGWALLPGRPVSSIEIAVPPIAQPRAATLGLPRPDVAALHDDPRAPSAGFECIVDLSGAPATVAAATVVATVTDVHGGRYALGEVPITLRDHDTLSEQSARRAAVLRARETFGHVRRDGELHVLAYAHSLSYGGAQYWLYELVRRLRVDHGVAVTVASRESGPHAEAFEKLGVPVHVTGYVPSSGVEAYEGGLAQLGSWIVSRGYNFVLANTIGGFPAIDVAHRLGLPNLWAIHESFPVHEWAATGFARGEAHAYMRQRAEHALGSANAVVFAAEATRRLFVDHAAERSIVVHEGIDIEDIDAFRRSVDHTAIRRRLGFDTAATVVLSIGVFQPRKAQTMMVDALSLLSERFPSVVLAMVGATESPHTDAVRALVRNLGLSDRVAIVPVTAQLFEWYAIADVYLCASNLESFPITLLQAMAFEIPVLGTKVFGIPELIEHGKTGLSYEANSVAALAGALAHTLEMDREELRAIGTAGGSFVRERYDSAAYARDILELMHALRENPRVLPADVVKPR